MISPFFWLLDDAGTHVLPLPDVESFGISPIANSAGAVELKYPANGQHFEDLRAFVDSDRDQRIAVWLYGTEAGSLRVYLEDGSGDEVAEGAVWTFTGRFQECRLEDAVTVPSGTGDGSILFPSATPGTVLRTTIQKAQTDHGVLTDLSISSFSATHDSNGVPWPTLLSLKYAPGVTVLKMAEDLAEAGYLEFEVTKDLALRAYVPGTLGTDRTIGASPVVLQRGRDLLEAPRRRSVREAGTDLLMAGANGLYRTVFSTTARARRGRRIMRYRSAGSVTDGNALQARGELELTRVETGPLEQTVALAVTDGSPLPLVAFGTGDWVFSDVGRGVERLRVRQVTLAGDRDGLEATASLNDLFAERDERLARKLAGLESGGTVIGTSEAPTDPDSLLDELAPRAPQGVGVTSAAYRDADGASWAAVFVSWLPVNQNADLTAATDITGYRVQYRYQAGAGLPTGWIEAGSPSGTTADFSSVVAGVGIDVRVAAVDRSNNVSAWSATAAHTTAKDATAPPVPSTPITTSYLGILAVEWNGRGSLGEAMPADFLEVEVHVSTTSGFTPSRPADISTSTTFAGRLTTAGTLPIPIADYGTTFFVKLVAVDRSRNPSAASAQSSAVLVRAGDGDISALNVGKLVTGVMSALMTVSGMIRTGLSGARVELDAAGLRCYSSTGVLLFEFSIPSSFLTVRGRIVAGAGVGVGATAVVDPPTAALDLYPNATNSRVQLRATTATDPNGSPNVAQFQLRTIAAGGGESGPAIVTSPDNIWIFHRDAGSGQDRGAKLFLGGEDEANGALLGYTDDVVDAFIRIFESGAVSLRADTTFTLDADGQVIVGGAADTQLLLTGTGDAAQLRVNNNNRVFLGTGGSQLISNGVVKSFVIDHPTDPDRWLVHGCTESPVAGVEYAGTAVVEDHLAYVQLPPYFEALCHEEGRTVHLTPELAVVNGMAAVSSASPSAVRDGGFHLVCPAPDGTRVHWLVKARRRGADFEPEPRRDDYSAHGDGPYRYLIPREDR